MLERMPDGWGVIVDFGSGDSEVRISPDELTEECERIRIKRVSQEATDWWLSQMNETFKAQGIARENRADAAKTAWANTNGFRVLPHSKRAKRIEWYFDVVADVTPAEARRRCETRWCNDYSANPYLSHLDDADLEERLFAIQTNSRFIDRETLPHELDEREWQELHEHVRYEYERRGKPFSNSIQVAERLAAWPRLQAARDAFARDVGPAGQLFKFGKIEHLEPLLRDGSLRVSPAATYKDPSLRPALRDDELLRTVILDGAQMKVTHIDKSGITRPIQAIGKAQLTASAGTNYYVWCTTTTFDPRLFDDFDYDACLVIVDAHAFTDRLLAAMERAVPGWVGCETLVHYYDPVRPGDTVLSSRDKDFRYAYQREYRFLWDPPFPNRFTVLPEINLKLGNVSDIARIVRL
jgi:hypothetical protein